MKAARYLSIALFASLMPAITMAQDYSITESHSQTIDLTNIDTVYLYCHCKDGVNRHNTEKAEIVLEFSATKDSVGYHGSQIVPTNIPVELLNFKQTIKGNELTLDSREYIYIHHGFFVDELNLSAPKGMKVYVGKIAYHELDRRRVD